MAENDNFDRPINWLKEKNKTNHLLSTGGVGEIHVPEFNLTHERVERDFASSVQRYRRFDIAKLRDPIKNM